MTDLLPFTTGDNSESVTSIPLGTTQVRTVIFTYQLPDLQVGDWLHVVCDMQATNPYSYNALFSTQLILADSPTATVGTEITEASGTNITPDMHHMQVCRSGSLPVVSTTVAARRYVNFVGGAASTKALAGHRLTIDQDYGRLFGYRIRGAL